MLHDFLNRYKNKNILFVGVGNLLKRDDGVGVYISKKLKKRDSISTLTVEVSIENYIGKINATNPDILVIVDAMDFNKKPGYWSLEPVENIHGYTTNTHNITLDKVAELFNSKVYILGIQPENIQFGEGLSQSVINSAKEIILQINTFCTKKIDIY
ncbi:MAG: hydrogenase maturation protease [Bacteroidales bacterium]